MIIELLTPLMLATAPATIEPVQTTYSHEAQASSEPNGATLKTYTVSANGTQTYDWKGNPNDNDSDNDTD